MASEKTPGADDLARRVAELEAELAKTKAERDEYKRNMYAMSWQLYPDEPLTEAEIDEIRSGRCQPETISALIAEMMREIGEQPT